MKSMDEIRMLPRILITSELPDGFAANVQLLSSNKSRPARVIGTWRCWWDHVSVSFTNRMPTWDEMAEIKRMFFKPNEACFEYHPPEEEYVNLHNYCLHIWRPQRESVPLPPSWMVGPKKGQTLSEVKRLGNIAMQAWEDEIHAQKPGGNKPQNAGLPRGAQHQVRGDGPALRHVRRPPEPNRA